MLAKTAEMALLVFCIRTSSWVLCFDWNEPTDKQMTPDLFEDDFLKEPDCRNEFPRRCNNDDSELEELFSSDKSQVKRTSLSALDDFTGKPRCQCDLTSKILYLGRDVYPTHIPSGMCKRKVCGIFHRCQPKKYTVKILRRKDSELRAASQDDTSLPDTLAENWSPHSVRVVVACECAPMKI